MDNFNKVNAALNHAFDSVITARTSLYQATEIYEKSKLIREQKQALAIFNGIEGKNVEQRNANLQIILQDEFAEENEADEQLRSAKCDYDLEVYELSRWKAMLRLLEVQATLESK